MAIKGRIQILRGLKADFDPSKLLPGEWAVSIDSDTNNQIVWMCFAAGVVKSMGTYEDFRRQIEEATAEIKEEYLAEFQTILDQIEELAEQTSTNTDTVVTIRNDIVNTYLPQMLQTLDSTSDNATLAESYAHGGTGTREGEDTDNAEYYYQQILKCPIKSANNLTTTEEGYVLDARQGKVLDDKIAETSLEWKKAIVGTSSWPDFSSVSGTKYVAAIPSSDYVAGGIYLIKLHNGSIHKVIARAIPNEQYGVKNGVVIIGDDVATATASGIQEDTTTGKKAWVTGSTAGYTSTNFAPLVISTSNSVTAWYCKLDWTVEDIISSSSAITDTGQYALDAREKNASVSGTLANQISSLKATVDGALDTVRTTVANITSSYNISNLYTFPSDGYIIASSEGSTSGVMRVVICDSNGNPVSYIYHTITGSYQIYSVYVKKGMKAYINSLSSGAAVIFYGL